VGSKTGTSKSTATSPTTAKAASTTHDVLTIRSFTITANPTGIQIGTTNISPGGAVTIGKETISMLTGAGGLIVDGTHTIPHKSNDINQVSGINYIDFFKSKLDHDLRFLYHGTIRHHHCATIYGLECAYYTNHDLYRR
jgi:hypothetical protein